MTSLLVSASTTASWTHFIAVSKSTISPLRTPREGACPTPRTLIVPSGRPSPTTTQIFEVPISKPTIKSLLGIPSPFLSFPWSWRAAAPVCVRGTRARRLQCFRHVFRMHRNRFHDPRLLVRVERVVDYFAGRFHERDGHVALHQ